jgi:hypothetical protein
MKKSIGLLSGLVVFCGLSACGSGSSSTPSNALTQFLSSSLGGASFGYNASSTSTNGCALLISAADVYNTFSNGGSSFGYQIGNQLCDENGNNCLNSNNSNNPCISGMLELNESATNVTWNNCNYNQQNQSFTADLTVTQGSTTCSGTVNGNISLKSSSKKN